MHCSNCRRGVIQISYFISLWSPKIKFYIQRNINFMFQHSEIWIACVGFYLSKSLSSLLVVNKRRKCFSHSHEVEAIVLSEFGKCLFQHICIIHVEFFPVKELLLQSDCNVDLLVILKKARGSVCLLKKLLWSFDTSLFLKLICPMWLRLNVLLIVLSRFKLVEKAWMIIVFLHPPWNE